MGSLQELFLRLRGADGAYQPGTNKIILPEAPTKERSIAELYEEMEKNNWYTNRFMWEPEQRKRIIEEDQRNYRDTIAHENEHKRQFNLPGSYFSKKDRDIWRGSPEWEARKNSGYSDVNVPIEIMANLVGGLSRKTGSEQNWPPYGWSTLTPDQKLWILKNRESHLTDQNYLENPVSNNSTQRFKHLGSNIVGTLQSLFE